MRTFMKPRHSLSSNNEVTSSKSDTEEQSGERHSFSSPRSKKRLSLGNIQQPHVDDEIMYSPPAETAKHVKPAKSNFFQRLAKKASTSPILNSNTPLHSSTNTNSSFNGPNPTLAYLTAATTLSPPVEQSPKTHTFRINTNTTPKTEYKYKRSSQSDSVKSSMSSPTDCLPIIQGTVMHEWGTPKAHRKGSPIVLNKSSPEEGGSKHGEPREEGNQKKSDTRRTQRRINSSDNSADSKKKNNRSARIFSNKDLEGLVIEENEDMEIVDKINAWKLNVSPERTMQRIYVDPTIQYLHPESSSSPKSLKQLESPGYKSSNVNDSSSDSSNVSQFSFEFNSTNGRKASVKYYGKGGEEEEEVDTVYFDDIYDDEDFDEDMNIDENADENEDFEYDVSDDFNQSSKMFGFNNITVISDDEGEDAQGYVDDDDVDDSDYDDYGCIAEDNEYVDDQTTGLNSDSCSTFPTDMTPITYQKSKPSVNKVSNFKDLFDLTDEDVDDENEYSKDYEEEVEDVKKSDNHQTIADVISNPETRRGMSNTFQDIIRQDAKKVPAIKTFKDLYALSDDDDDDNEGGSTLYKNDFNDDFRDDDKDDHLFFDEYSNDETEDMSDSFQSPPKRILAIPAETTVRERSLMPSIQLSPVTPTPSRSTSPILLGKKAGSTIDSSNVVGMLSPRSPVTRLPPNTILKYHDLTTNYESDVVPRTMGDLFFIDEVEEEHNLNDEDLYLDEINKVPEDYEFESTTNTHPNGSNIPHSSYGSSSLSKNSYLFSSKKNYKKSHSFYDKPLNVVKSTKPLAAKVELKNQNKTVTFFHMNNQQLQRSNSDPGKIFIKKPIMTRHQSETLLESVVIMQKDVEHESGKEKIADGVRNNDSDSGSANASFTPSNFSDPNSLSPIQEGLSSPEASPRMLRSG